MVAYADTSFLVSLYLAEATSKAADAAVGRHRQPLPLTPLGMLEMRSAFNLAVKWHPSPQPSPRSCLSGRGRRTR